MGRRKLKVRLLYQRGGEQNPLKDFNYKEAFERLNIEEVKEELFKVMTDSKAWWPADFGHYGPLFVRLAWHSAGTYRIKDGRRGANRGFIRIWPIYNWPDNTNLDKAIRLLWPVKKRFGPSISWGDLIILAGNVALESMGFKTIGFAGGRVDSYLFEEDIYYEKELQLFKQERSLKSEKPSELPTAASTMGLIYVNPEGPKGKPDPVESALEIREAFRLMGMDDEETVALIAGGHSFGKCHGAGPVSCLGEPPDEAPLEEAGLGWKNSCGKGRAEDTITSGFELAWTKTPVKWSIDFLEHLFKYNWKLTKSPAGLWQWVAQDAPEVIPDAFDPNRRHRPMMLTTDLALRFDPVYREIALKFLSNPERFEEAFAKAWFKLTHRDLGPENRYLWKERPRELFVWQEPLPPGSSTLSGEELQSLKREIKESGIPLRDFLYTAWSAASTYRDSDKRGGANGAKIALEPQISWEVNEPETVKRVAKALKKVADEFSNSTGKRVSLADLIVLAGNVAVEEGAKRAGLEVEVPFTPGRADAEQHQVDVETHRYLEPEADGFRNYLKAKPKEFTPEELFIDKAQQLTLTAWEMAVLTAGLRVLGGNFKKRDYGVLTERPGALTNDFFVNLLSPEVRWQKKSPENDFIYEGYSRETGKRLWEATRFDLIFVADSELRAVSEVYGFEGSLEKFVRDFVSSWVKVMELDRFDVNWR
ncbi:catalase/peroxidase HPI [Thermovibrio ammonificans]